MKTTKLIPAFVMDGIAVLLIVLGIKYQGAAEKLGELTNDGFFAEQNIKLQEKYESYALFLFIGASVAFIIGAIFILKAIKNKKKAIEKKTEWEDIS